MTPEGQHLNEWAAFFTSLVETIEHARTAAQDDFVICA